MADGFLVEGIKLFGGLAGLGTAAFTIYDRLIRSRPVVNLTAPMPPGRGVRAKTLITVRNPGTIDIIIEEIATSDKMAHISNDESFTSLLEANGSGVWFTVAVPAGGERSFRLLDERDDDTHGSDLTLTIRWRPVTARFGRRPRIVYLPAGRLRALEDDAQRRRRVAEEGD